MAYLSLRFLGAPSIELDARPVHMDTRKAVALLAYLAANGSTATRDKLVTLLWSPYGRKHGQAALRRTLSTLRRDLGPELLCVEGESVRLPESPGIECDVLRARELLRQCAAHNHGSGDVCRGCIPLLKEAADLHRGDFLQGFTLSDSIEFDDWQFFATEDFRLQHAKILDALSRCLAATGDHEGGLVYARRRLSLDPLDEAAHALVMRHYAWAGNRAAALRQYDECRRILEHELQARPGKAVERLSSSLRNGEIPAPPALGEADAVEGADPSEGLGDPAAGSIVDWESASAVVACLSEPPSDAVRRLAAAIVERFHGAIRESGTGELTAAFDNRSDSESNPELAVRAALELADALRCANILGRVGVASGRVSGRRNADERSPAGIASARASRLARRTEPGSVLVGEHTYRLTREAFRYSAERPADFATPSQPTFYRLAGLAPLPRKARGFPWTRTKLIGRQEDFSRLVSAFERSTREGGHVALITGDAGIGKSRLLAELFAHAQSGKATGPEKRRIWLEGRCLPPTISVAYWPFIDMLRELLATTDELPVSSDTIRVARGLVSSSAPQAPDGGVLAPEQAKRAIFSAISSLFRSLAEAGPLVLAFEDLHWADELSLELIGVLMDNLEGVSALLVCVYRMDPDHKSRHIAAEAARRRPGSVTEIHLREMARPDSERLLESIAGRAPFSNVLRELVLERAGGNPFFLEELVNSLATRGEIDTGVDAASAEFIRDGVDPGGVPEAIKAVILTRFDRLPERCKELLRAAATIGRVFSVRLLEASTGARDLGALLEDLQDRGFVFEERTLPQVEYSFKHALTQEAIYQDLPDAARAAAHERVAEAYLRLAAGDPEAYCEQLAHHYDRAGIADRAIDYYFRSGDRARSLFANEAAVRHFSRGLELIRAAPPEGRALSTELGFLIALGVPLVLSRGHYASEVETAYLRAKEVADRIGTSEQQFQVMLGLRRLQFARGEHRLANATGEEMLELARRSASPMLAARAHMMMCESLVALGKFDAVLEHSIAGGELCVPEEYRAHLIAFGNDTAVGCRLYEAIALWHLGLPDQARLTAEAAVARAREESHAFTLVFALYHAALVAFMRREPARVAELASELVEIARRESFPLYIGFGPILQGWALGALGEADEGAAMIPESFDKQPHAKPFASLFACMLAELYWTRGTREEAMEALDAGLASVRTCDAHLWEPELSRLRAEFGRTAGEAEVDAERWLERALRIAHGQHARSLELRACAAICRLKEGRAGAAEERNRLAALRDGFTEGFETPDLIEAARLLGGRSSRPAGIPPGQA